MLPYLIALAVPSALSFAPTNTSRKWRIFGGLTLVLFMGLRHHVGADWFGYTSIHLKLKGASLVELVEIARSDIGSYFVFWLSINLFDDMLLSNLAIAAILVFGSMRMCERTPNPWLGVTALTPYLFFVIGMSGLRQAMAVGVVLWGLSDWRSLSLYRRLAVVAVATSCHTSAIVTILLVVADLQTSTFRKILAALATGVATAFAASTESVTTAVDIYQARYFSPTGGVVSEGSLFHLALLLVPALIAVVFRHRYRATLEPSLQRLVSLGILASLALPLINVVSSTVASRLSLYVYFLPAVVYGALPRATFENRRAVGVALVVAFHYVELTTWLLFANNSWTYLPYRTIFSDG
jgi:hypothetical protein